MTAHPQTSSAAAERRRRPADRRRLIIDAAAKAFSEGGYHTVRLDDIADVVGISAPALYRHFPTKYALFAETTAHLADVLATAIGSVETDTPTELDELLAALTAAAIENRRTGGLYRWESRYLRPADAETVRAAHIGQHRRIRAALRARRHALGLPDLSRPDADLVTAAMISVVASPSVHRTALPARDAQILIRDAALTLVDADLPGAGQHDGNRAAAGLAPAAKREIVLAESIPLFAARGFHDVTIDDIAHAAGIPSSGVYRHFESKTAILEAAFWRAADRVTASTADALAAATTPREAIVELVSRYVRLSCDSRELLTVYVSEIGHVGPRQRTALRNQQRITVDEWAAWVVRYRTELSLTRARFLVHASLNVTADLLRIDHPPTAAQITALATRVLLGQ